MNHLKEGMNVVCNDNTQVEEIVRKNDTYTVAKVCHRGALVKLKGIPAMLASTRFIPVTNSSTSTPLKVV